MDLVGNCIDHSITINLMNLGRVMKALISLATCAALIVSGLAWNHYLRVPSNSGEPIDVSSVVQLGQFVFEPNVGFELPIRNQSKEEIQVLTGSDCSCIQITDGILKLRVDEHASVRGEVNLNRFREDTKLRWRFSQDIFLEVRPFGTKKTVSIEGEVVEPIRLDGQDLTMVIDSEDPATFERNFNGVFGDEFEIDGASTSTPGLQVALKASSASNENGIGRAVDLGLTVIDSVPLQLNASNGVVMLLKSHGKEFTQKIPVKIVVLKQLRVDSSHVALGVVSPGKQQILVPYRLAKGSEVSLKVDQVKFGSESISVQDVDGSVLVEFEVSECPPQNRNLRIPFSFRQSSHSDPINDEVVIPVSYSCI